MQRLRSCSIHFEASRRVCPLVRSRIQRLHASPHRPIPGQVKQKLFYSNQRCQAHLVSYSDKKKHSNHPKTGVEKVKGPLNDNISRAHPLALIVTSLRHTEAAACDQLSDLLSWKAFPQPPEALNSGYWGTRDSTTGVSKIYA